MILLKESLIRGTGAVCDRPPARTLSKQLT
jgi:hypothetical protein